MKELENLSKIFSATKQEVDLVNLARQLHSQQMYKESDKLLTEYMEFYRDSPVLALEHSIAKYYTGDVKSCYEINTRILSMPCITENVYRSALFNVSISAHEVEDSYTHPLTSDELSLVMRDVRDMKDERDERDMITFTMTTCKRFDLFTQTMNSFLRCCTDIQRIDRWIIVDDNSSDEDREKMEKMYPFAEFYFKLPEQKGHAKSMNILRDLVTSPYVFHMEDDWKFYEKKPYITLCLDVVSADTRIGQCCINKGFGELPSDWEIVDGVRLTTSSGTPFHRHEYVTSDKERLEFEARHSLGGKTYKHCNYWPHYSLRPGLMKTKIWREIGAYDETASHFELDYATRYTAIGYSTCMLAGIYSKHIGRLTKDCMDKSKVNAYSLNNESQFVKRDRIKSYVVNLERRSDRFEKFISQFTDVGNKPERFIAVDGSKLEPSYQLSEIFNGNDYKMRRGMVGCALSHLSLWINLVESDAEYFIVYEDDAELCPGFELKLQNVIEQIKKDKNIEMVYFGYHTKEASLDEASLDGIVLEKRNVKESFEQSIGGTFGYIVSKSGARKYLEIVNEIGFQNGVDTFQQLQSDYVQTYYTFPKLVDSECYRAGVCETPDTDIQFDFDNLSISLHDRSKFILSLFPEARGGGEEFYDAIFDGRELKDTFPVYFSCISSHTELYGRMLDMIRVVKSTLPYEIIRMDDYIENSKEMITLFIIFRNLADERLEKIYINKLYTGIKNKKYSWCK